MKDKVKAILEKIVEKIKNIGSKLKSVLHNTKEKLKKVDFLKKVFDAASANRMVLSLIFFCVSILILILVAILGWKEFVVPVCLLMILEVAMAVLLHRSELWIHGILLALQLVAGIVIDRLPLTILCILAYIVSTITLVLAFQKSEVKPEEPKQEEPKQEESKESTLKKKNKKK